MSKQKNKNHEIFWTLKNINCKVGSIASEVPFLFRLFFFSIGLALLCFGFGVVLLCSHLNLSTQQESLEYCLVLSPDTITVFSSRFCQIMADLHPGSANSAACSEDP